MDSPHVSPPGVKVTSKMGIFLWLKYIRNFASQLERLDPWAGRSVNQQTVPGPAVFREQPRESAIHVEWSWKMMETGEMQSLRNSL